MPLPEGNIFDSNTLLFCNTIAGPSTSQLVLIPPESRRDGDICWVESVGAPYIFRESSTETPDGVLVVQPSSGTGRWVNIVSLLVPIPVVWGSQNMVSGFFKPDSNVITSFEHSIRLPGPKLVKGLVVRSETAPGAGITDTFIIRKNGVDTLLIATLADAEISKAVDNVYEFFAKGDTLSLRSVAGAGTASSNVLVTVEVY